VAEAWAIVAGFIQLDDRDALLQSYYPVTIGVMLVMLKEVYPSVTECEARPSMLSAGIDLSSVADSG
jgi:hypothetical protein